MKKRRIELNLEELDRIIDRGTQAPLTEAEGQKIKTALHLMAEKLLPSKRSTEKTSAVLEKSRPASEVSAKAGSGSPAGHGRHGAVDFGGATRVSIPHPSIHAGNSCPDCGAGKVYRQKEPATLLRIVGQAPLQTTLFEMERLRCNACGQIFTAVAPETAGPDKYAPCAVAMIALLKYGTGMPFKRLERLEGQLAMPLPAATQWELMEAGAKQIRPALQELIWHAGQGSVLHNDDTSMRILQLTRETGDKRTGIFTSGIVSIVGTRTIALFFTGTKHAGENIAEVLKQRDRELPVPIQMCDALSRNTPKAAGVTVLLAHCMAHGRRQIVDVAENFPEEQAQETGIHALKRFVQTLKQDLKAVEAAVTEPWSNGPVEGHINRLKTIKRQMYGRAGGLPSIQAVPNERHADVRNDMADSRQVFGHGPEPPLLSL